MDKLLSNFGIYDIMGIWVPGAIAVTYYFFTAFQFFQSLFQKLSILSHGLQQGYLLIFLYTIVAYTVGIVLHELGKYSYDLLKWFNSENISYFNLKSTKKPAFRFFKRMKYDYNKSIDIVNKNNISLNSLLIAKKPKLCFEEARSHLKYNNTNINLKRIDVYHSIYALSRSLSIAFLIHIIIVIISLSKYFETINWSFILIDILCAFLFLCRAYRYYLSWVKNTFIQYFLCIYNI